MLFSKCCLIITVPEEKCLVSLFETIEKFLKQAWAKTSHFDGVVPNSTTDVVSKGAVMVKEFGVDVVRIESCLPLK